jgi:hypothetical protein
MAGSPRMVPTFIADRSTGAAPSFSPAASPRVRRRPSSWPPRRPRNSGAGVAHPVGADVHCCSAHIHQVGADAALEGVQPLVRSRYTFPSRLPDPSRLAVPARPVVVGAAPVHTLRFQGRTAPSFSNPLRRAAVGSLIPLGQSTPRGALRARSATGRVAGATNRQARARSPSSKPACPTAFSQESPCARGHRVGTGPEQDFLSLDFMPRPAQVPCRPGIGYCNAGERACESGLAVLLPLVHRDSAARSGPRSCCATGPWRPRSGRASGRRAGRRAAPPWQAGRRARPGR